MKKTMKKILNFRHLKRAFRRLFENKRLKGVFGLNLMAMSLFAGVVMPPLSAFTSNPQAEITNLSASVVQLTTENSVRFPLDNFHLTQGYSMFHPGVDLAAVIGTPVYPIMNGVVEDTLYGHFDYGNHIIINHGSGLTSLYGHLSKIIVKKGQEVDKNTVIGLVGSTGWSTGPHLHLEVRDNDRAFNPFSILK